MLTCSHILCRVENIADTVRDYEALGFSMEWGSAPGQAHNALLWFDSGPFIEFFQIPQPFTYLWLLIGMLYGRAAGNRWRCWSKAAEGWCDIALEPKHPAKPELPDAGENYRQLQQIRSVVSCGGIPVSRMIKGNRKRPDGVKVRYSLFAPASLGLPFVVSHYDPPQRPVKISHSNGASGVAWVKLGVSRELMRQADFLTSGDKYLRLETLAKTSRIEVGLAGLTTRLEAKLLHGAVFFSASEKD